MSDVLDLLRITLPVVQAPMAAVQDEELAIAASRAGGLGSVPCAMLSPDQVEASVRRIEQETNKPYALNFFCHETPEVTNVQVERWRAALAPFFEELGISPDEIPTHSTRKPFDADMLEVVRRVSPPVLSFHFGMPQKPLLAALQKMDLIIIATATTAAEARWLTEQGVHAIVAQGEEAGGHRGHFLQNSPNNLRTDEVVAEIAAATHVPVIAAGGIATPLHARRSVQAGAQAVQAGTAYLLAPEARATQPHREQLLLSDVRTVVTNVMTGRHARGIATRFIDTLGPLNPDVMPFPTAANGVAPLHAKARETHPTDFATLWAGSNAHLCEAKPAAEITAMLAEEIA